MNKLIVHKQTFPHTVSFLEKNMRLWPLNAELSFCAQDNLYQNSARWPKPSLCVYVCVWCCMSTLLCVSLPVARLLPPPWLSCTQTAGSPTAAPAHCFNMFWQRKLYHSSRRPSAARSMKLKCASWLWRFGCCSWLITKAIWPTGGFDMSSRPDVFYTKKERKEICTDSNEAHSHCVNKMIFVVIFQLLDHAAFSCDAAQLCPFLIT